MTPSGYIFRGNLVPLDLNSGRTWSQMRLKGIGGKQKGLTAGTFPLLETTWNTARSHFPGAGEFPIIMKDATGTYWNVFGEAMNGEHGGTSSTMLPILNPTYHYIDQFYL